MNNSARHYVEIAGQLKQTLSNTGWQNVGKTIGLSNGMVQIMGPTMQGKYLHGIPKGSIGGLRYN
jgi:UDP-N-acetylglucosamine:LPS N-acetylglucosamine transferase